MCHALARGRARGGVSQSPAVKRFRADQSITQREQQAAIQVLRVYRASSGHGPDRSVSFRNGTMEKWLENLNRGQDHSSKCRL